MKTGGDPPLWVPSRQEEVGRSRSTALGFEVLCPDAGREWFLSGNLFPDGQGVLDFELVSSVGID